MIDNIGSKCTGCYSCINICPKNCISMVEDEEGFWYPETDLNSCIGCNLCEKKCPVLNEVPICKSEEDVKVFAFVNNDLDILAESSSGGAFSALAEYILDKQGVVFGAAYDDKFDVRHICVDNKKDLRMLRGSKYVQSRIGDTYKAAKKYLDEGRWVLFSGTACQTTGLISYLGKEYERLVTQDLICHGVPSPMAWRKYLEYREKIERSKISTVFCRDKSLGWHDWHIEICFTNGEVYKENQRDDMMMKSFLRGKCSRECCYDCKFKQKVRLSDFTLADFWGIENIKPELDDEKGLSSVYVNSKKAMRILNELKTPSVLEEMNVNQAIQYNMSMVESEKKNSDRKDFLKALSHGSFDMVSGKYNEEIGFRTKIRWTLRRWLGREKYEQIKSLLGRKGYDS